MNTIARAVEEYIYWMEDHLGVLGHILAILSLAVPIGIVVTALIVSV